MPMLLSGIPTQFSPTHSFLIAEKGHVSKTRRSSAPENTAVILMGRLLCQDADSGVRAVTRADPL